MLLPLQPRLDVTFWTLEELDPNSDDTCIPLQTPILPNLVAP